MSRLKNLTFKIGGPIILIELIILSIIGVIYINNFSNEIDHRLENNIQIPGKLMNAGLLNFDSITDNVTMKKLMGEELLRGMVVGINHNVYYSSNQNDLGININDIPEVNNNLFNTDNPRDAFINEESKIVSVSIIYAVDKVTPQFFLYIETGKTEVLGAKTNITYQFIAGSFACVILTSIAILYTFNSRITSKLAATLSAINKFREGKLDSRIPVSESSDEISALQNNFNNMADTIEETFHQQKLIEEDLRQSQEHQKHLNQILLAIRNVNQLLITTKDQNILLQRVCELLIETKGYLGVWIGLVGSSGGLETFYSAGFDKRFESFTEALKTSNQLACLKLLNKPGFRVLEDSSKLCEGCTIHTTGTSMFCATLSHENTIYGIFGASVPHGNTDLDEQGLFKEVVGDIGYGLYSIQIEKARIESERKLLESQKMAHIGNYWWDVKTGEVKWSEEVYRIFKLDPKNFTPQIDSIMELSAPWPEDNKRNEELIQKATKDHSQGWYEQRFLRPDKSIGHHFSTFQGKYDESGKLVVITGTVQDITERKRIAEKLRDLARFPSENVNPVMRIAKDGTIMYSNAAGMSLLSEWKCEIGQHAPDQWHQVVNDAISSGLSKEFEVEHGDQIFSFVVAPIPEAGYVNIYGRKITERKKAEDKLRRYSEQLEELVADRTSKLKEQNIRLKKLDKMKSRFISTATHELRTPLVSIKGYTELIRSGMMGKVPKKIDEMFKVVERNADRLSKLTDDLLDQQRIESGRLEITSEPFQLQGLIEDVVQEFQPFISKRNQVLTVHIPNDLPQVIVDRTRVGQVIINLLSNASKFTPSEGNISIKARETGKMVEVQVSDNGTGIAKEDIPKLFNPFPDIPKPSITESSVGLGLSICKGIIALHGGKIWAESEGKDKGATFTFTIPKKGETE